MSHSNSRTAAQIAGRAGVPLQGSVRPTVFRDVVTSLNTGKPIVLGNDNVGSISVLVTEFRLSDLPADCQAHCLDLVQTTLA
jgi:hypothetical protein